MKACLGILYLLEKVKKDKLPSIFENLLGIQLFESKTIISHLEKEEVISSTINYYLLENEQLGIE